MAIRDHRVRLEILHVTPGGGLDDFVVTVDAVVAADEIQLVLVPILRIAHGHMEAAPDAGRAGDEGDGAFAELFLQLF